MIDSSKAWWAINEFLRRYPNKQERTNERSLKFSKWVRRNCRPSKNTSLCAVDDIPLGYFVAFDLDWVFYDYHRRMMQFLEVKTHRASVSWSQQQTFRVLDELCEYAAPHVGVTYCGLHYLVLSGETPRDSDVIVWDGQVITEEQCWRRINMLDSLAGDA